MRNRLFGSARADHQEAKYPKDTVFREGTKSGRLFVLGLRQGVEGDEEKQHRPGGGNDRPKTCDQSPMRNSDRRKEQGGNEHDEYASPTEHGMKETHGRFFSFGGARFDDGGDDYFEKSRADGIQTGRNDEARHGRQKIRQKSETAKPECAQSFSGYRTRPIADFVHEFTR